MVLLDLEMKKYNLGIWRLFLVLLVISNFIACKELNISVWLVRC